MILCRVLRLEELNLLRQQKKSILSAYKPISRLRLDNLVFFDDKEML
jgi:hypothetical protein